MVTSKDDKATNGQDQSGSTPDSNDSEIRRLVRDLVRKEFNELAAKLTAEKQQQVDPMVIFQQLLPMIQQTIFESIRLGMSMGEGTATQQPSQGELVESPFVGSFESDSPVTQTEAKGQPSSFDSDSVSGDVNPPAESDTNGNGMPPWLFTGQVTLLVSPFKGFGEVHKFLKDLANVPQVHDIKPHRFSGGRLYITLDTECLDTKALADILETELVPYHPTLRSVQSNLIELLLRPS